MLDYVKKISVLMLSLIVYSAASAEVQEAKYVDAGMWHVTEVKWLTKTAECPDVVVGDNVLVTAKNDTVNYKNARTHESLSVKPSSALKLSKEEANALSQHKKIERVNSGKAIDPMSNKEVTFKAEKFLTDDPAQSIVSTVTLTAGTCVGMLTVKPDPASDARIKQKLSQKAQEAKTAH